MSSPANLHRPLASLKQALRQCRAERQQIRRSYATSQVEYPSLRLKHLPPPGFRTSQTTKQNRFNDKLRSIPVYPPPRSTSKACPDPIKTVTEQQIKVLDPSGARTRLFSPENPDRVKVGDILLVRLKNGDPFSGVCIHIRQRHQPVDTAILLRNQLTRVGVEMWYKVYSPNVEGIEVVQRKQGRRARRAKLTYMRLPKHDLGSVEGIVRQYMRGRAGGPVAGRAAKGRDANSHKKKSKKDKT